MGGVRRRGAPHSLTLGTQLVGRFSVDDDNQLHGFYIDDDVEESATGLFARIVEDMDISAAMASTVDPIFLSRSRRQDRRDRRMPARQPGPR